MTEAVLAALVIGVILLGVNVVAHRIEGEFRYLVLCLVATVVLVGLGARAELDLADIGLAPSSWPRGLIWAGALTGAVALVYSVGAAWKFTRRFFHDERHELAIGKILASTLIVIPLGTVLLEEVAFRGILLALLWESCGFPAAVTISSLLFGLWHILPAWNMHTSNAGLTELSGGGHVRGRIIAVGSSVLGTAVGGALFCLLRYWSDSLLAPIGLHWALNGLGVMVVYLVRRRLHHLPPELAGDDPAAPSGEATGR